MGEGFIALAPEVVYSVSGARTSIQPFLGETSAGFLARLAQVDGVAASDSLILHGTTLVNVDADLCQLGAATLQVVIRFNLKESVINLLRSECFSHEAWMG